MEIALNFLWVLLVLPAAWVYRRQVLSGARPHPFSRVRLFLILAAILVLLFPIVSATDDLRAVGFLMEEPSTPRWAKQLAGERSCSVSKLTPTLGQTVFFFAGGRNDQFLGQVW